MSSFNVRNLSVLRAVDPIANNIFLNIGMTQHLFNVLMNTGFVCRCGEGHSSASKCFESRHGVEPFDWCDHDDETQGQYDTMEFDEKLSSLSLIKRAQPFFRKSMEETERFRVRLIGFILNGPPGHPGFQRPRIPRSERPAGPATPNPAFSFENRVAAAKIAFPHGLTEVDGWNRLSHVFNHPSPSHVLCDMLRDKHRKVLESADRPGALNASIREFGELSFLILQARSIDLTRRAMNMVLRDVDNFPVSNHDVLSVHLASLKPMKANKKTMTMGRTTVID